MGRLTPPQILILSFLTVILIGTILLFLPAAADPGKKISLVDSLFTATSATCVTGLTVKDTGTSFSGFGKWVIFFLFQTGGLGIMTFSTLFAVLLGRRIGFRETDVIKRTLAGQNIHGFRALIKYILLITIGIEAIGVGILFLRWRHTMTWGVKETLRNAVFHSVSGFCNAGFSLFKTSLTGFYNDPVILFTMMTLILLGGIGFIVIMDLVGLLFRKGPDKRISLQSKIALSVTFILIASGAVLLLFFENGNTMKDMSFHTKVFNAMFQSITARTAGFNTINMGQITAPAIMVFIFLMFVGASPGSTGGGIKTTTFAVIVSMVVNMLKNRKRVMILGRSVPKKVIREALVIFLLALAWVFVFTTIISWAEWSVNDKSATFSRTLFEVISAFGTVGLSTGITAGLSAFSKICLVLTMLAGRVGPLTLALALAFRDRKDNFHYPEEQLMVG